MGPGLRLALTTFTVLPVRGGPVDRAAARTAMTLGPAVGALLGLGAAVVLLVGAAVGTPAAVGGLLAVGLLAVLSRGLHLDGLADTVDGLGAYGDRDRTLAVMKAPDVGPFGVVALVVALGVQAAGLAGLSGRTWPAVLCGTAAAVATGRLAVTWACLRPVPAARPDGLGALVAGTVPPAVAVVGTALVAALAVPAVPGRPWQGPVAVALGLTAAALLLRQVVRRIGGITGDVLGAVAETAVTATIVVLAAG
ncbi:MAG TPA: adenosylcobinamide-GDP ribazoletransferase [Mycobacteriales bacterium]